MSVQTPHKRKIKKFLKVSPVKIAIMALNCIVILVAGCANVRPIPRPGIPDWVSSKIAQFQAEPVGNPPQSIWQYEYNGETVFYMPPQCCDQYSQLLNESGKLICAPDGGIIAGGDGKCPDFFRLRKNETLIWRDPRSK
jgi:hypothetical protein